jgi:4-amino-4-deoxy-L-arabinose transferase-like glycosyltransferase
MQQDRAAILLAPLLLAAAAIRIAVNDIVEYSRSDETVYLLYTKALVAGEGYTRVVRMFLDDPGMWVFPNPLRWSWLGATTAMCGAAGECTHRTLATLSTLAGIAAVFLTFWIARELFGAQVALAATALAATSPLQLALGRRALADEFFCALFLASLVALLRCTTAERPVRGYHYALWIAATTLVIAAKEQFLFLYPVVVLFWWLRTRTLRWQVLAVWAAPPIVFALVYSALARDVTSFFRVADIITSAMTAPYAEQYQSGPPHRLILDSLSVAPVVTLLALAGAIAIALRPGEFSREHRHVAVLMTGLLAVHALLPSQNLRYIVAADPLMRVLAAAFVFHELRARLRTTAAIGTGIAANAAIELSLFWTVFVTARVYDPVTDNLLRALKMLPH